MITKIKIKYSYSSTVRTHTSSLLASRAKQEGAKVQATGSGGGEADFVQHAT